MNHRIRRKDRLISEREAKEILEIGGYGVLFTVFPSVNLRSPPELPLQRVCDLLPLGLRGAQTEKFGGYITVLEIKDQEISMPVGRYLGAENNLKRNEQIEF